MSQKIFLTHVKEVFARDVVIRAEDSIAAQDEAEELCNCSNINLDGKDFLTREITVFGEIFEDEAKNYLCYGNGERDADDRVTTAMDDYFFLEKWLYKQKDKSVEAKSVMVWSALTIAHKQGLIDRDKMCSLYGEFMSKIMKSR